ncbi:hypothetical protein [Mycobacterium sp. OTB74]|uniref:hypothetical protein n=1 Tax=Mycobacterium sp. OTB74 TaxID=1853452 RepID=UPI00247363EC|nr:hypothetical protein [Mycobacterium sp. OTB74]MDH6247301.1 hypothetical protein [Mycobacterium sp. OTB74]
MSALTLAPARTFGHARRWCSTTTWGSARWQSGLAAAIAAVIFWPQASVDPVVGLDPSWQAGLALARMQNLAWGPGLVFAYGPLGFLQTTAYYSFGQSLLATIYQPIIVAALFLGIAAALRQRHAPMTSLIGAFVTTGIVAILHIGHGLGVPGLEYPELAVLAAFAWGAVPLLEDDPKRSTVFTTCIVLGAAAGFQLLVKFNIGPTIVTIALAVSVLLDWRAVGRHCATVSAFAASTCIWWVLAGQRPVDLPAWLKSSAAVTSGYSEGMAMPLSPVVVLILAGMGALCVMFVRGRREIPRRYMVLVGLVTAITAKTAFARLDLWHIYPLLAVIVVTVAITPFSGIPKISRRAFVVVVAAIVLVGLGIGTAGTLAFGYPDRTVAAVQAPVQAVDRLVTLALPGHVDQRVEQAKARQRALYAIPDRFIKTVGSGTVHIDPDETSAIWAYDFAWRPAPGFQTYQAYTPALDDLNSESLVTGPQFVLSRLSPTSPATSIVDGRLGVQESPRYSRALLCNYTVKGVENRWALFTHSGPHCGPLTELSQVPVRGNDVVTVPAPSRPDTAVLVGIDLQPTVVDRLFRGTVAPLTIPTVVLDAGTYRLIAANAAEPFLVNTPASVAGTNLQIHAHTISVGRAPSMGQSDVAARLRFYEMSVEP